VTLAPLDLLLLLGLPLLAGASVLRALGVAFRDDRVAFLGWAWLAGALLLSAALHVWSWFALPHPRAAATAALLLAAGVAAVLPRPRRSPAPPPRERAPSWESALFAGALVLALLVALDRILIANAAIVCVGDEAAIWAGKAKALHYAGGMGPELGRFLSEGRVGHPDYPAFNPLLQWWTFLHAGGVVEVENRLPIQAFVPAAILVGAGALRRLVRPSLSAALLLLLTLNHGMLEATFRAGSDGIVAFGLLVAADAWLRFASSGERRWWALLQLGLAGALWAKNEGTLLAVAFALALAVAALRSAALRARFAALGTARLWVLAPLLFEAGQRAFNLRYGLTNDLFGGEGDPPLWRNLAGRFDPESLSTLARWFGRSWFAPDSLGGPLPPPPSPWLATSDQNLLFPALVVAGLSLPRRAWRGASGVLLGALGLAAAGFALVYLGTVHDLEWHLKTSVGRVLFQLAPAAAVALAALHSAHGLDDHD
jgi:hypothetical protein